MPVTIKPEPLFFDISKEDRELIQDDILSREYIIEYDGGTIENPGNLDIDFVHGGPVVFYDANGELPLYETIKIEGAGDFKFRVKVDKNIVNGLEVGSHDYTANIKTTERIPEVTETIHPPPPITGPPIPTPPPPPPTPPPPLVWHEIQVAPGHPNDLPNVTRISLGQDEISVMPQIRLLEHKLYDTGNEEINDVYPEGGYTVEPAYVQDEDQVHVTEIRLEKALKLVFENRIGLGLDTTYIIAPSDTARYVGANAELLEVEIYLESAGFPATHTPDPNDPDNLKGINTAKFDDDNPFLTREEDDVNFNNPDSGGMA